MMSHILTVSDFGEGQNFGICDNMEDAISLHKQFKKKVKNMDCGFSVYDAKYYRVSPNVMHQIGGYDDEATHNIIFTIIPGGYILHNFYVEDMGNKTGGNSYPAAWTYVLPNNGFVCTESDNISPIVTLEETTEDVRRNKNIELYKNPKTAWVEDEDLFLKVKEGVHQN